MMIEYHYEGDFTIDGETRYSNWIRRIVVSEGANLGQVSFIFCDDAYLIKINQQYLKHDTFTDIISFDYSSGNDIGGDIFISYQRVRENAVKYKVTFDTELRRVMAHGLLHLLGYNDKAVEQQMVMRAKEDEKIKMFHVEQ